MPNVAYYHEQADRCRRLAAQLNDGDSSKARLLALAKEFDGKAAAAEGSAQTTKPIGADGESRPIC
jgi:hypothetical protein